MKDFSDVMFFGGVSDIQEITGDGVLWLVVCGFDESYDLILQAPPNNQDIVMYNYSERMYGFLWRTLLQRFSNVKDINMYRKE